VDVAASIQADRERRSGRPAGFPLLWFLRVLFFHFYADLNYKQSNNQTINWLHGYPGGRSFVLRERHRDPSMFKSVACVT
jgi:hypothetical protein